MPLVWEKFSAYSPGILHFILNWNKMFDLHTKFYPQWHCKKRRHKIRDTMIIFQNRIKWGGYQNLHDSFFWLNRSWQTISIKNILMQSYLYAQAISKILYDMPLVWEKFSAYSRGILNFVLNWNKMFDLHTKFYPRWHCEKENT